MWQFHLVEDYQDGSAVILRIHHSYADGIALIHVLLALTDPAPESRANPGIRSRTHYEEAGIFRRFSTRWTRRCIPLSSWAEG